MPRKAEVKAVSLSDKTRSTLSELARSRTAPAHHVERSAIILHLADQRSASETASAFGIDRQRVTRALCPSRRSGHSKRSMTCRVRGGRRSSPRPPG